MLAKELIPVISILKHSRVYTLSLRPSLLNHDSQDSGFPSQGLRGSRPGQVQQHIAIIPALLKLGTE